VQRILELEEQVAAARRAVAELQRQHQEAVRAMERRGRRDLVPVTKDLTVYRRR